MAHFEIISTQLTGGDKLSAVEKLFYIRQSGLALRHLKITLQDEEITTEAGALHYMHGKIEAVNKAPSASGFLQSALTGESTFKPKYKGTGTIYLEPTFSHFVILELKGEALIVDKGIYYASDSTVSVGMATQKNVSSALFGGEGFFQTQVSGTGKVVLVSPTPEVELAKITLNNEKLSVDGNFAILRSASLQFKVEKSSKGLMGSMTSGEGVLQTFDGTGIVWLAPFKSVYDRLGGAFQSLTPTGAASNPAKR